MDIDWDALVAQEFPAALSGVHLKAAGGSPMCRSAYEESRRYLEDMYLDGDVRFEEHARGLERGRALVARYLGVEPGEIGYTVNSSTAADIMAGMLRKAGVERVYHQRFDFPATVHAIRQSGMELVPVGTLEDAASMDLWQEATREARRAAIVVSHVGFLTGQAVDLAALGSLCRERGLVFCVNATQSFGALAIDAAASLVDVLFATGLKWACAGYGAGFVYLRQGLVDAHGLTARTGWLSVRDPMRMDNTVTDWIPRAQSLDAGGGFPHFGPLLALLGALGMYERLGCGDIREGIRKVQRRVIELAGMLRDGLEARGFSILGLGGRPRASGIVSVVPERARALHAGLAGRRIFASCRRHPETDRDSILRFGVHVYDTPAAIATALDALGAAGGG